MIGNLRAICKIYIITVFRLLWQIFPFIHCVATIPWNIFLKNTGKETRYILSVKKQNSTCETLMHVTAVNWGGNGCFAPPGRKILVSVPTVGYFHLNLFSTYKLVAPISCGGSSKESLFVKNQELLVRMDVRPRPSTVDQTSSASTGVNVALGGRDERSTSSGPCVETIKADASQKYKVEIFKLRMFASKQTNNDGDVVLFPTHVVSQRLPPVFKSSR